MPITTTTTTLSTTAATGDYLRTFPPTWDLIQKVLAIFALVVILRFCIRCVTHWCSSLYRTHSAIPVDRKPPVGKPVTDNIKHFRPRRDQNRSRTFLPWSHKSGLMMDEEHRQDGSAGANADHSRAPYDTGSQSPEDRKAIEQRWRYTNSAGVSRYLISRPPPAPPLTPPGLSSSVFTLEGRPYSQDSFIHQPNPDYASSSTPSSDSRPSTNDATAQARRFSYTKTIPIGVPLPHQPPASSRPMPTSSAHKADLTFSPSSYPPTSPLLPPAPPGALGAHPDPRAERTEIDLHGQVVSVLDMEGTGWSRHTRVYGGGVCLACQAAGRDHGAGGFYGATVTPEEMR